MKSKSLAMLLVCALLGLGSTIFIPVLDAVSANPTPDTAASTSISSKIFSKNGIAIWGADPVAYFTQGKPVQGRREHTYKWNGVTWLFANAQHQNLFTQNPEAYAPQYGGFCAYGVAQSALVEIDPQSWAIVENKLYLNYNPAVQRLWQEDVSGYIAQADKNWPQL